MQQRRHEANTVEHFTKAAKGIKNDATCECFNVSKKRLEMRELDRKPWEAKIF